MSEYLSPALYSILIYLLVTFVNYNWYTFALCIHFSSSDLIVPSGNKCMLLFLILESQQLCEVDGPGRKQLVQLQPQLRLRLYFWICCVNK